MCFAQNFGRNLKSLVQSRSKIKAFTLAEVLITLAIIGVVAALTIPTVVQNYQKKMYVTQLKKTYNTLTNGFKTAMAQDGVTRLTDTTLWSKMPSTSVWSDTILRNDNLAFKDELLKTFKVAGIYDSLSEEQTMHWKYLNGEECEDVNFGIFLADGSWLWFYVWKKPNYAECNNKDCKSLKEFQEINDTPTKLWERAGDIQIDVNGAKGPNIVGRDVFIFALSNDGTLYPFYGVDEAVFNGCKYSELDSCEDYWKKNNQCSSSGEGIDCAARIMEENWNMNY